MSMDQQKLRVQVFEKTGIRIDVDDPVFALVALNEAVLAEAVERHIARIDAASAALAAQLRQAGGHDSASHGHPDAAAHPPGYAPAPAAGPVRPLATQAPLITARELRLLAAAAAIAVVSALTVLGAQALF